MDSVQVIWEAKHKKRSLMRLTNHATQGRRGFISVPNEPTRLSTAQKFEDTMNDDLFILFI